MKRSNRAMSWNALDILTALFPILGVFWQKIWCPRWKIPLENPWKRDFETLNFKMSLDASALRNLCLWCEFQSCLLFIISLLLENFLTALPHSLNNIITENQTVSCSRSLSFLSFFSYWFVMFVWMFCCLRDMFDAGFQQQSKGKGSVGSHTTRSVSLCQVLLKFRRVHYMYLFRIVVVLYCNTIQHF